MSCAVGARLAVPVARRVVLVRAQRVSGITARASSRITGPVLTRCKQKDALHRVRTVHLSVLAPRRGLAASTAVATNAKSKASATSGASAIVSDTDKPLYEAVVVVAGGIEDDGSLPAWVTGGVVRESYSTGLSARHADATGVPSRAATRPHRTALTAGLGHRGRRLFLRLFFCRLRHTVIDHWFYS